MYLLENINDEHIIHTHSIINLYLTLYFIDMLKALYYCHYIVKVIHRDIKPDNIMINHNNEAVLIDFGISQNIFDGN